MTPMRTIQPFIILLLIPKLISGDCRKSFIYHPKFKYGYDIFCSKTSASELSTTMAVNEISLTIVNSNLTITPNTFKHLSKIRQLNLTSCQITSDNLTAQNGIANITSMKTKANMFNDFENLEILIIQQSVFTTNAVNFSNLLHLETLILDDNRLEYIANNTFKSLNKLNYLSLKQNNIKNINSLSLCDAKNIRHLDLSDNAIRHLNNSNIACLGRLETLYVNDNAITALHSITSNTLKKLSLKNNKINSIYALDLPMLTILNLAANKLLNITRNDLSKLISLERLYLNNNNLTLVDLNNTLLIELDLSGNNLTKIPKLEMILLKSINLSSNYLSSMDNWNVSALYNLETVELSNNKLTSVDRNSFTKMKKLSVLNLSNNELKNCSLVFDKYSNLTLFNVSYNQIDVVSKYWFTNLEKLKTLDLSHNKIKTLNQSTFENLSNLEILNISNNFLAGLDYKLVEPLENLMILDVDDNLIEDFDYGTIVSYLPNLDAFKIKNNLLTCAFLTKLIRYFKDNDITVSLNEHLDFDKENVEGIYCKETEDKLQRLKQTEEALKNSTQMLKELYSIYNSSDMQRSYSYSLTGGEIVACILSLISIVVLITLAAQKTIVWYRRRQYLVDELELISSQPYKSLN